MWKSHFPLHAISVPNPLLILSYFLEVTIQATIEAHSKKVKLIYTTVSTCSEQNLLGGYCLMSSRSPAVIYKSSICAVPWESPQTTLHIIKC